MSFVSSRLFFERRSISCEMSTALSSWTKRSSSIFCSSSAMGCSKSKKLVFTGEPNGRGGENHSSGGYNAAMAKRLTKIVTRTGDDGTTGLGDGTRVRKDALRVAAMGDVDELSSAIGCVLAEPLRGDLRDLLASIQNDLFDLGGEVCIPGRSALRAAHVERLD